MPRLSARRKKEILGALRARGLTQSDMADALGVTRSHLNHVLAGRRYSALLVAGVTRYLDDTKHLMGRAENVAA